MPLPRNAEGIALVPLSNTACCNSWISIKNDIEYSENWYYLAGAFRADNRQLAYHRNCHIEYDGIVWDPTIRF